MARYSSTNQFSPAGTVIAVGSTFSNKINTEAARDARVLLNPTAFGAGATLDTDVYISDDDVTYYKVASFAQLAAATPTPYPLEEHQISKYMKLKYTVANNPVTLGAKLEAKFGI